MLELASDSELDKAGQAEFKQHHAAFGRFVQANALDTVRDGTAFSLLTEDPRLQKSRRLRRDPLGPGADFSEQLTPSTLLFDHRRRQKLDARRLNSASVAKALAVQLAPQRVSAYKLPLLLRLRNRAGPARLELLMPASAARPLIAAFYRAGVRVGALSDRFVLAFESADPSFPFHWLPMTTPKSRFRVSCLQRVH